VDVRRRFGLDAPESSGQACQLKAKRRAVCGIVPGTRRFPQARVRARKRRLRASASGSRLPASIRRSGSAGGGRGARFPARFRRAERGPRRTGCPPGTMKINKTRGKKKLISEGFCGTIDRCQKGGPRPTAPVPLRRPHRHNAGSVVREAAHGDAASTSRPRRGMAPPQADGRSLRAPAPARPVRFSPERSSIDIWPRTGAVPRITCAEPRRDPPREAL
jgi:hypothetical protein